MVNTVICRDEPRCEQRSDIKEAAKQPLCDKKYDLNGSKQSNIFNVFLLIIICGVVMLHLHAV